MPSLQGQLLISAPELRDPNFFHTVVLLIRHNEEGAFGLVLNRPASATIDQVWPQVSETPCESEEPLRLGGPVAGPLMALHTLAEAADLEVGTGTFFCAETGNLERLIAENSEPARFFVGYAGWAPGQLENEVGEGSWLMLPATPEHVFNDEEEYWERLWREVSREGILSVLKIPHMPSDPSLN